MQETDTQETTLKDIYQDQRAELEFRRNREQTIFMWSSTILIAIIAWFISSNQPFKPLGKAGYFACGVGVIAFTAFSLFWQGHQRDLMRNHQRVLSEIAKLRGWFKIKKDEDKTAPSEGKLQRLLSKVTKHLSWFKVENDKDEFLFPEKWKKWGTKRALGMKWFITLLLGATAVFVIYLSMGITSLQ